MYLTIQLSDLRDPCTWRFNCQTFWTCVFNVPTARPAGPVYLKIQLSDLLDLCTWRFNCQTCCNYVPYTLAVIIAGPVFLTIQLSDLLDVWTCQSNCQTCWTCVLDNPTAILTKPLINRTTVLGNITITHSLPMLRTILFSNFCTLQANNKIYTTCVLDNLTARYAGPVYLKIQLSDLLDLCTWRSNC